MSQFDFGQALAQVGQIWSNKADRDQALAQQKLKDSLAMQQAARENQSADDNHQAAQAHAANLIRQAWQEREMLHPGALVPTASLNELSPADRMLGASPVQASAGSRIYTDPDAAAPEQVGVVPEGMSKLNLPESEKMRLAEKQSDQKMNLFMAGQQGMNDRASDRRDLDEKLRNIQAQTALAIAGMRQPTPHYVTRTYQDENGNPVSETMTAEEAAGRGPMKAPKSRSQITAEQGLADLQSTSDQIQKILDTGAKVKWAGTGAYSGNRLVLGAKHYLGTTDPDEEKLRDDIGFVKSGIQHDLYGSAFTKTESGAGNQFLMNIENNPTELPTRLKAYKDWLDLRIGEKKAALPGGTAPGANNSVTVPDPNAAPTQRWSNLQLVPNQ